MQKVPFSDFCKDLDVYFGRKTTTERMAAWYQEVDFIPHEALPWIKNRIFADCDSFPINFPKKLRQLWGLWRQNHPEKLIRENVTCDAPGCRNGFIHVEKDGIRSVGYCDQCAVSRHVAKPDSRNLTNLAVLNDAGFREW